MDSFYTCNRILENYGQEHLLAFYDDLDDDKKAILLNQILQIDFEQIQNLYQASFYDYNYKNDIISPLSHIDKSQFSAEEINIYEQLGVTSIKKGEVAVITLAGGQRNTITVIRVLKVHLNWICLKKRNLYLKY